MSYPYYPYPPMLPYIDPLYMMYVTMQWIWIPYYYALTIEMYRAIIEAWRRTIEAITKSIEGLKIQPSSQ